MKRTSKLLRNRHRMRAATAAARGPAGASSGATAGRPAGAASAVQAPGQPAILPDRPEDAAAPASAPTTAHAMAHWLMGDWPALVRLPERDIAAHPERDRVALLVACAHQQCDAHEQARHFVRRALEWGCHPALVARLLISSTHNTMGRIAALREDKTAIDHHFRSALRVTGDPQAPTAAHARAVREMARLGLLPQAAALVQEEASGLDASAGRPVELGSRIEMLRSEVELLQHELSIALQRNVATLAAQPDRPATPGTRDQPPAAPDDWRRLSTSQLGQDLWVLDRMQGRRGGFFVEFGATDGVRLSNSYLLEKVFGWRGICIEPNPKLFRQLQGNRHCTLSPMCIGPRTGERVSFVLAEEYGGMAQDMHADMHAAKRDAYWADPSNRIELETVSLHDALTRLQAPRDIDYLSIDTEGSEFDILAAFPFEAWNIRFITVEHNFSPTRERLRQLLEPLGYRRTEAQWDDWYERIDLA